MSEGHLYTFNEWDYKLFESLTPKEVLEVATVIIVFVAKCWLHNIIIN